TCALPIFGRRPPELTDPLFDAQGCPDLEVDLHRGLDLVLGRLPARLVLVGVGGTVMPAEPRRDPDDRPQPLRVCERDVEGQLAAQGEADEGRTCDLELVEDTDDVLLPRPRHCRPGRAAEEAEVGPDRAEPLGEERDDRLPQPRVAETAVQEQDGLAAAGLVVPEACAVDVDRRHSATLASVAWSFHTSSSWGPARWAVESRRSSPRTRPRSRSPRSRR